MTPIVRPLVGELVSEGLVGWLFGVVVRFTGLSVIISKKVGELHVHAPIGALVNIFKTRSNIPRIFL